MDKQTRKRNVLLGVGILAISLIIFHILHYSLYCRNRCVPEKSHCSVCGHRKICRKLHHRSGSNE